jgi:hypothetical protein
MQIATGFFMLFWIMCFPFLIMFGMPKRIGIFGAIPLSGWKLYEYAQSTNYNHTMSNIIASFYQVLYNYYANFKKNPVNPFIAGWSVMSLFWGMLLLNLYGLYDMISGRYRNLGIGKGQSWVLIGIVFFITYQILFNLLKIRKRPQHPAELFEIDDKNPKYYWAVLIINFILFFSISLLRKHLRG